MKRWITFAVSFLLVLTVGCRNENEPSLNASAPSFRGSVSEPAALDVSDLHDILASVDLFAADLTYFCEGTEETFAASNAIRAKSSLM